MKIGNITIDQEQQTIVIEKDGYGVILRESGISFIDNGKEITFEDYLNELGNVKLVPLIEAEWIQTEAYDEWKCSNCGNEVNCYDYTPDEFYFHYCAKCGAKMTTRKAEFWQ